jgi:hypothetical protein
MLPREAHQDRAKDVPENKEIGADARDSGRPHLVDHEGSDVALIGRQRRADQIEIVDRGHREGTKVGQEVDRERDGGEYGPTTTREASSREKGRDDAKESDEAE